MRAEREKMIAFQQLVLPVFTRIIIFHIREAWGAVHQVLAPSLALVQGTWINQFRCLAKSNLMSLITFCYIKERRHL